MNTILLEGLRGQTLLGFLSALGVLRAISDQIPSAKLSWVERFGGWTAELQIDDAEVSSTTQVTEIVFSALKRDGPHPALSWERFLGGPYTDETDYFSELVSIALKSSIGEADYAAVFSSQLPVLQNDALENFDHPFRAGRSDYYTGNLRSVLEKTSLSSLHRTIALPWDYMDAMANQSLRLDHGDDRRHAYQWHAPTNDPDRSKVGCMLGANRLALEAFPLFPCIPTKGGNTAVAFICRSKTYTWVSWPIWTVPISLRTVKSVLNLELIQRETPPAAALNAMGISAVFRSRRLPVEKNKVFLPPMSVV